MKTAHMKFAPENPNPNKVDARKLYDTEKAHLKDEGKTIPLTRLISVEDSLDFVVNRAAHSLSPQLQPVI